MVSLVDGLTRCAVRAWGQDTDSNWSVWLPRRTEAQAGHRGELRRAFDRAFETGKYSPLFTSLLEAHRKHICVASGKRLAFLPWECSSAIFFGDQNIDDSLQNECDGFKSNQAVSESDECISHLRLVSPSPCQAEVTANYFN